LHLSRSAYNEIQMVVAKDHFSRHLNELTFRRWDDFAGKLHTFRRCERPERKENAATDTVADMARILTFRRWDDFAGNCTPSECAKGRSGRKTRLQTLWRTWQEYSPSKGGTIPRGNCTPS
jgi:hypothetical protein